MAANIHPVAFVLNRPRDSADLLARLQKNRFNIGPPKQLKPSRQPRRPGPDDHCSFTHRKRSTPEKNKLKPVYVCRLPTEEDFRMRFARLSRPQRHKSRTSHLLDLP